MNQLFGSLSQLTLPTKAAKNWWLAGDIPSINCKLAYQAKGAANYAASKVNLANPGTYNLLDTGGAVSWDATNGWMFSGSNYLNTQFVLDKPYVFAWRYKDYGTALWWTGQFGTYNAAGNTTIAGITPVNTWSAFANTTYGSQFTYTRQSASTFIMNVDNIYDNGILIKTLSSKTDPAEHKSCYIGGFNKNDGAVFRGTDFDMLAFAIYDSTLSAAQITALNAAMNAL